MKWKQFEGCRIVCAAQPPHTLVTVLNVAKAVAENGPAWSCLEGHESRLVDVAVGVSGQWWSGREQQMILQSWKALETP